MIFSPFFTRFGRERPAKKPRWAVFRSFLPTKSWAKPPFFAKDLQKVPILRGLRAVRKGKVGKRVFFAGFPFGLSPAVCTRVRKARSAGCAASRMMKGNWAKSRHVSRNSCALLHRSRAVLSPQTQQPHPRRQGEGGVGEMWPPRCCSGAGAQEGAGQLAVKGERHGAMGTGRAIAVERGRRGSGAQEGAGTRSALVRARDGIRSEDRHRRGHRRGRRRAARRRCRAARGGSCRRDARRPDGLQAARAFWRRRRC